jgi:hypothetical protein
MTVLATSLAQISRRTRNDALTTAQNRANAAIHQTSQQLIAMR